METYMNKLHFVRMGAGLPARIWDLWCPSPHLARQYLQLQIITYTQEITIHNHPGFLLDVEHLVEHLVQQTDKGHPSRKVRKTSSEAKIDFFLAFKKDICICWHNFICLDSLAESRREYSETAPSHECTTCCCWNPVKILADFISLSEWLFLVLRKQNFHFP